jgi:hypothetical protein
MKKLLLTLAVFLVALSMSAQYFNEWAVEKQFSDDEEAVKEYQVAFEKQKNDKTSAVRTSWIANRPGSNWFISLEGGLSWFAGENYADVDLKDNLKPMGGLSFGKWFSPVWGLRMDINGGKLQSLFKGLHDGGFYYNGEGYKYRGVSNPGTILLSDWYWIRDNFADGDYKKDEAAANGDDFFHEFKYVSTTLDFMLNLKNVFSPYNPNGVFDPVVYAGLGYAHTLKEKGKGTYTNEEGTFQRSDRTAVNSIIEKIGLQFNFRLGKRVDFYLQGDVAITPEQFDRHIGGDKTQDVIVSGKVGLTYHINFRYFMKSSFIDQSQIDALNAEINDLRNRQPVICPPVVPCPPPAEVKEVYVPKPVELEPVFFTIDSYVVRDNQLLSVAKAAQYLIDNPGARLEIAAYADKNTGTPAHNWVLSNNRVKAVLKVLTVKFGIDKSRVSTSFYGDTVQPYDQEHYTMNRVAIFIK